MTRKFPLAALLAWAVWTLAAAPGHAGDAENSEAAEIPSELGAPSLWSGAEAGFRAPDAPPSPIFSDLGQRQELPLKLPPADWAELHGFREYGLRPVIMPVEKAQTSKKGQIAEVSARGALDRIGRAEVALKRTLAFSGAASLAMKARNGFENSGNKAPSPDASGDGISDDSIMKMMGLLVEREIKETKGYKPYKATTAMDLVRADTRLSAHLRDHGWSRNEDGSVPLDYFRSFLHDNLISPEIAELIVDNQVSETKRSEDIRALLDAHRERWTAREVSAALPPNGNAVQIAALKNYRFIMGDQVYFSAPFAPQTPIRFTRLPDGNVQIVYKGRVQIMPLVDGKARIRVGKGTDSQVRTEGRGWDDAALEVEATPDTLVVEKPPRKLYLIANPRFPLLDGAGISGRTFVWLHNSESIAVDPENPRLRQFYDDFLSWRKARSASSKEQDVLSDVVLYIRERIAYDRTYTDDLAHEHAGQVLDLGDVIVKPGKGVCRHMALLAGYLVERLHTDGHILSSPEISWFGGIGHAWVTVKFAESGRKTRIYVLDPAQQPRALRQGSATYTSRRGTKLYRSGFRHETDALAAPLESNGANPDMVETPEEVVSAWTAEQPLDAEKLAHLNNLVLSAVLLDNPARTLNFINSQDPDTRRNLLARLKDALAAAPFSAEIIVEKLSTSPEGKQLLDDLHRRRPDIQHLRTAMSMDEVDFSTLISVLPLFPELLHTVSQRRSDVRKWLTQQLETYAAKPRAGEDFLRLAEKLDVQELADAFARNPSKHPAIIRYLKLHREGFFEVFELAVDRVREEASRTPAAKTRRGRKT